MAENVEAKKEKYQQLSLFQEKVRYTDINVDAIRSCLSNLRGIGLTNPYIQNQRVKKIGTLFNGGEERKDLEDAVTDPDNHESDLRGFAKSINEANYPLYRKNKMGSDILTYHHYTIPLEKMENEEERREDEILIESWRTAFRPKYQFRRIAHQVSIYGKVAYYYRQNLTTSTNTRKDKIDCYTKNPRRVEGAYLQQLPGDYWKIVGFTDKNYFRVSFNFMYFMQPGTSVTHFDEFFAETYAKICGGENSIFTPYDGKKIKKSEISKVIKIGNQQYLINLNAKIDSNVRFGCSNGQWFYWADLPVDKCFVFSEQEATPIVSPSTAGVFLQAKDLDSYALLQQELSALPLNSMVVGEIPYHDNNLTGNAPDDFKVSLETMIMFNDMFNETAPTGTGVQGLPYTNLKLLQFQGVTNSSDIYLKAVQQFLISTGLGSLFTLTDKPNEAQVKTAQKSEVQDKNFIYRQFENFVDIVYKRMLKLNYLWEFHIFGDCFSDAETLQEYEKGLSLGQSYLLPAYIAMKDFSIQSADTTCDYVKNLGIYDKFMPLASAYNSAMNVGGRPTKAETENKEGDEVNG